MGLRDKISRYRAGGKEQAYSTLEFDIFNFIIELLNANKIGLLINTILLSFMSKFNVNKVLINFLDDSANIYKLIGNKGINSEEAGNFTFDYQNYFLKALQEPMRISELIREPRYKEELSKVMEYDFKIIFPLHYKKELWGFITFGNKIDGSGFTYDNIEQIKKMTRIITVLLYNIYFYQNVSMRLDESEKENKMYLSLIEGIKNINLAENLDEALIIFYRIIKDSFNIRIANIMLKEKGKKEYKVFSSMGLDRNTDSNFVIPFDEMIFTNIMELNEAIFIPDFKEFEFYKRGVSEPDKERIKIFYSIPVKIGIENLGFFNIFDLGKEFNGEVSRLRESIFSILSLSLLPYIINKK